MKGTCIHKSCTGLYSFTFGKGFLDSSVGKESACNAGDPGLIARITEILWMKTEV